MLTSLYFELLIILNVKLSDSLVDKSLHGQGTDRRHFIGRQFDFHDVIYHKRHCNVDNGRRNVVFTIT